ncbi:MAG: hypothetical protein ACM34K_20330 [Bacillota bacterium]
MNKTLHAIYISFFFLTGITITIGLAINGFKYYETPLDERFFSISHEMLKPSGQIGHGLGISGSLMMTAGVAIYMIRKRVRRFMRAGLLKHWLELHIFLCSVGPLLILFHTAFKFGGLVAISFWSMIAVVISGVIGKYIYVQIPRTIQGRELDIKELNEINEQMTFQLRTHYYVDEAVLLKLEELTSVSKYRNVTLSESIILIVSDYYTSRKAIKELKLRVDQPEKSESKKIIKIIKQKLVLSRRIGLYRSMQKLFKYWHIVHLPFAMIMFIIMFIHIAVAIAFGYRWIF